jgi:hypothetical protein
MTIHSLSIQLACFDRVLNQLLACKLQRQLIKIACKLIRRFKDGDGDLSRLKDEQSK